MLRPALSLFTAAILLAGTPPKAPLGLPPIPFPLDNPYSPAKAELGRMLFFDPRLSANGRVSCASCHKPEHAFADNAKFSPGIGGELTARNTPSLINRAYGTSQFWDGRAATLEEQAAGPLTHAAEMGGDPSDIERVLRNIPGYAPLFQAAFDTPESTYDRVLKAIATFERTIVSGNSAWDRYQAGDANALSAEARQGMGIFFGKGKCAECHSGFNFTNEQYTNIGVGVDRAPLDEGRSAISKSIVDFGKFKVPTLRESARTAPYMHDGRVKALENLVAFYNTASLRNTNRDPRIKALFLDADELKQLAAFLESLNGEGWQHIQAPEKLPQ
jgi:cytochrome c peroxidase